MTDDQQRGSVSPTAAERVAALNASRSSPGGRHPAHGARRVVLIASLAAVAGLTGGFALTTSSAASTSSAATTASTATVATTETKSTTAATTSTTATFDTQPATVSSGS